MFSRRKSRSVIFLIVFSLLATSLSLWRTVSLSQAESANSVYLPIVFNNFPPPPTVYGAQVYDFTDPEIIQLAVQARISWLRIPAFDWSLIEPNPPVGGVHTYDWSKVPESSLKNIASNHMYAIATVQRTPTWAQKYAGVSCGPIAQAHMADFALFLQAAMQRYGKAPYNVQYLELGNEPDVDRALVPPDSGFGCWGEESDTYYGGGYYAEMLKVVYPAVKAVDSKTQVLIGGLLLDCDPDDSNCTNPKPARFFEGILKNGGGNFFDIVSFHGYPHYSGGIPVDENFNLWDQRGGVVLGKASFLREVMASYGINKPLLHTEGALLCPDWNLTDCNPPDANYEDSKADYVIWLFVRAAANDFEGSIWYTLDGGGWRNGGLIGDVNDPNPAYDAFKFMTKELADAQYLGQPLGAGSDLRSYAFKVPGKTVWVVWSPDSNGYTLVLPSGYTHVYDKLGNSVSVSGGMLVVKSPIYIELP